MTNTQNTQTGPLASVRLSYLAMTSKSFQGQSTLHTSVVIAKIVFQGLYTNIILQCNQIGRLARRSRTNRFSKLSKDFRSSSERGQCRSLQSRGATPQILRFSTQPEVGIVISTLPPRTPDHLIRDLPQLLPDRQLDLITDHDVRLYSAAGSQYQPVRPGMVRCCRASQSTDLESGKASISLAIIPQVANMISER